MAFDPHENKLGSGARVGSGSRKKISLKIEAVLEWEAPVAVAQNPPRGPPERKVVPPRSP